MITNDITAVVIMLIISANANFCFMFMCFTLLGLNFIPIGIFVIKKIISFALYTPEVIS